MANLGRVVAQVRDLDRSQGESDLVLSACGQPEREMVLQGVVEQTVVRDLGDLLVEFPQGGRLTEGLALGIVEVEGAETHPLAQEVVDDAHAVG